MAGPVCRVDGLAVRHVAAILGFVVVLDEAIASSPAPLADVLVDLDELGLGESNAAKVVPGFAFVALYPVIFVMRLVRVVASLARLCHLGVPGGYVSRWLPICKLHVLRTVILAV